MALGDTSYDDATYTGDTGDSVLSLQYYRNKANEFQEVLTAIDAAAASAQYLLEYGGDADLSAAMEEALAEYDARRWELAAAVQAVNAGASVLNAMDIRFPVLSLPPGLGVAPIVLPVGALAAVAAATAAAATLIVWGRSWIQGVNDRQKFALTMGAIQDPDERARIAAEIARTDAAVAQANSASWSDDLVGIAKWAALGLLGFLAITSMR